MEKITFVNGQAPFLNEQNLNQLQTNVENAIEAAKNEVNENIPTKITDLENDSTFLVRNADFNRITGRVHITNTFDDYQERKVDLSLGYLIGAESGGLPGTLHINEKCDTDVHVLKDGTGTLYYKDKEVATQEYVDEQISNIETTGGGISEIPIASATTLGGIKVGANLTIDEDGTLNASASGGSGSSINIDALPIGSVLLYDGDEIPQGFEEVEEYQPVYSLNETRIGTWYNGKPIYRKVYIATKQRDTQLHINLGDTTDIEDFWINNGISHLKPNLGVRYKPLNTYESADYYIRAEASLAESTGDIYIAGSPSDFYAGIVRVVFEYTKISDKGVEANETN
jgi:hypothetical protein